MNTPLISVVVPTYRRAEMLPTALDSLAAQTFADFEVLVCDNGAEPEVAALVAAYGDDRFRYCPRETNLGMLGNALQGLRDARGAFVTKLDDDDAFAPGALAALAEPIGRHPELTMVFGKVRMVGPDGEPLPAEQAGYDSWAGRAHLEGGYYRPFETLALHSTCNIAAGIVRKDTLPLEDFPMDVATAYDMFLALIAAADAAGAYYVPEYLVDYRLHPGSDTNAALPRQLRGQLATVAYCKATGRYLDLDAFDGVTAVASVRLARELLRTGDAAERREARALLFTAARLRPTREATRLLAAAGVPARLAQRVLERRRRAYDRGVQIPVNALS